MSRTQKAAAPSWGKSLNANSKAFVPPGSSSNLKPTARTFTPGGPAPVRGGSAWGKKPSTAVRTAAPPPQNPQQTSTGGGGGNQHKSKDNGWRQPKKDGGGGGSNDWQQSGSNNRSKNRRGPDKNGGRGGRRKSKQQQQQGNDGDSWQRAQSLPVELLKEGGGKTDAAKAVKRITAESFLSMRLQFLDAPAKWASDEAPVPPEAALWDDADRVSAIQTIAKQPRMAGDVSRKRAKEETAPPAEECAPLVVNDETRWKAKVFTGEKITEAEAISDEDVLKKALLILNKLSLTKFDKLSDEFIQTGIGRNEECLRGAIGLVVDKAQQEPHFSAMYARLCVKLSKTPMEALGEQEGKKGKKFKKMLLTRCQDEFEQDTATKIEAACKGITDEEEITYLTSLIKKNYLGHMRFIGELYKGDLVSIRIILSVIPHLLDLEEGKVDEEKVECFTKLMTTIGASLESQSNTLANNGKTSSEVALKECWDHVIELATAKGPGSVSSRIRFMLQDLIEMRDKGWQTRRKEETAKTLDQIHKEVAKEEARANRSASSGNLRSLSQSSSSIRRGLSSGDVRKMSPQKDDDGFVQVRGSGPVGGFNRSRSSNGMNRSYSDTSGSSRRFSGGNESKYVEKGKPVKRSFSGGAFAALNEDNDKSERKGRRSSSNIKNERTNITLDNSSKNKSKASPQPQAGPSNELKILPPDECQGKTKSILKEYFVGGDIDDAVLSIHEMINPSADDSQKRASAILEAGTMHVMEMKLSDVDKFLTVLLRSFKEDKITSETIHMGLCDPLEFLNDIAIDAPLAPAILCRIMSMLIKEKLIGFECLLQSPHEFKTYGKPAKFASKVLKELGKDAMKNEINKDVVRKLMTEEDKSQFMSVDEIIESV